MHIPTPARDDQDSEYHSTPGCEGGPSYAPAPPPSAQVSSPWTEQPHCLHPASSRQFGGGKRQCSKELSPAGGSY